MYKVHCQRRETFLALTLNPFFSLANARSSAQAAITAMTVIGNLKRIARRPSLLLQGKGGNKPAIGQSDTDSDEFDSFGSEQEKNNNGHVAAPDQRQQQEKKRHEHGAQERPKRMQYVPPPSVEELLYGCDRNGSTQQEHYSVPVKPNRRASTGGALGSFSAHAVFSRAPDNIMAVSSSNIEHIQMAKNQRRTSTSITPSGSINANSAHSTASSVEGESRCTMNHLSRDQIERIQRARSRRRLGYVGTDPLGASSTHSTASSAEEEVQQMSPSRARRASLSYMPNSQQTKPLYTVRPEGQQASKRSLKSICRRHSMCTPQDSLRSMGSFSVESAISSSVQSVDTHRSGSSRGSHGSAFTSTGWSVSGGEVPSPTRASRHRLLPPPPPTALGNSLYAPQYESNRSLDSFAAED